jgi:hypothetical protein
LRSARNIPLEDAEQALVIRALRERPVDETLIFYAIANGGLRSKSEAGRLKHQGVRTGMPDIGLLHRGRSFFLEMKRRKGGRLSDEQIGTLAALERAGAIVGVARGADEALNILLGWQLIKAQ